jgi:hypothetical protein
MYLFYVLDFRRVYVQDVLLQCLCYVVGFNFCNLLVIAKNDVQCMLTVSDFWGLFFLMKIPEAWSGRM